MSKLAVIFPGIGYHCDKPLLYYSKKLLKELDYEIAEVNYTGFKPGIKGSKEKMIEAFEMAMAQTKEILSDVEFEKYDQIVFVMKSVGTAVGCAYAALRGIFPGMLLLTPVEQTFGFVTKKSGIAFHGSSDSWADTEVVKAECDRLEIPLHIIKGANHSLETGNIEADLVYLHEVMRIIAEYLIQS